MITQIYSLTEPNDAIGCVEAGADYIGVVVGWGARPWEISYERAKNIFDAIGNRAVKLALTRTIELDEMKRMIEELQPDILHLVATLDRVTPRTIQALKALYPQIKFMRAIPVINESSIAAAKAYDQIADYLILETFWPHKTDYGATGETHDWDISRRIVAAISIPVVLAGGLGPQNVAEAMKIVKPFGVDSKTKTDISHDLRRKDLAKVRAFVERARLQAL